MFTLPIIYYLLSTLDAPIWCWVLWWAAVALVVFDVIMKSIKRFVKRRATKTDRPR